MEELFFEDHLHILNEFLGLRWKDHFFNFGYPGSVAFYPGKSLFIMNWFASFQHDNCSLLSFLYGYWPAIQTMASKSMDGEFAGFI